jgi:hypothetical protein
VVEAALAIDQEERPADAIALADALRNGAHGLDPFAGGVATAGIPTRPTRRLPGRDEPTAATRLATPASAPPRTRSGATARAGGREAGYPVTRSEPRRAARPAPAGTAAAERRRSRRGARRLLLFLFVVLLFVAAVAVAITLAASTSSGVVHFRTVVAHDVQGAIKQVQSLINQYTK